MWRQLLRLIATRQLRKAPQAPYRQHKGNHLIVTLYIPPCSLGMDGIAVAGLMCTAVFEGDLVKLRRLLRSGAPPNAADYDKRCALHIAGAEGSLAAVKLLVEEGGADPGFQVCIAFGAVSFSPCCTSML